jgi:energy-converting hydrogenase B subunit C
VRLVTANIAVDLAITAASVLILAASFGLLRFGERRNIVYARIHIAGVVDVACIFLTIILGYPIIGLTYLMLVPLSGHAIAHAHYHRSVKAREDAA